MPSLIMLLFFSLSIFAADWSEIEVGKTYTLSQSFELAQVERSSSLIQIMQGEKMRVKDIVPVNVPGASMTLFIFDYANCPGPMMKTEMKIISVQGQNPPVEVGAYLENCELLTYIETKDFYFKSLFY